MKKVVLIFVLILSVSLAFGQSDEDLAGVYIKRAEDSFGGLRFDESLEYFEKALKYMDTITNKDVANLGMRLHFELYNFKVAEKYGKQYFLLEKNKNTELFKDNLDLIVTIKERIEDKLEIENKAKIERLRKEKELARIDSLKLVWTKNSEKLSIKVDSIYPFNKNNFAIYKNDDNYGILDDFGNIIVEADQFKDVIAFEGFIILKNRKENPTKLFSYNTATKKGFVLPKPSEFNASSTNYGRVMLPRKNGRLVAYPNNVSKTMVYDLNEKKFVKVAALKELLKTLRKNDKIEKYNNDGQVRLDREYYNFGGHIGGGIHPLYTDDFSLHGYLFTANGKVAKKVDYGYLGAFDENRLESSSDENLVWLNENSEKVNPPKDNFSNYEGLSVISRIENGNYQLKQDGIIVLGEKKLVKMVDFIRNNASE